MTSSGCDRAMARIYAAGSAVFVIGLYLDGWSHQFRFSTIDSFFNPWHAVLYGGFAITALCLAVWTQMRRRAFRSWAEAIPRGHGLSAIGALAFLWAGLADLTWHQIFGFEKDLEGFISPTHLILAAGMALMLSGNVRHWIKTRELEGRVSFMAALPLIIGMLCMLAQWTFLTQYGRYTDFNASGVVPEDGFYVFCTQSISILGIIVFSALVSGLFTYVCRRVVLPFGSVTLILTVQILLLALIRYGIELTIAGIIGGLIADTVLYLLPPHRRPVHLLIFSFVCPAALYAVVLIVLHSHGGLWWSLHLWTGVPVVAGGAGLLAGALGGAGCEER